MKLHHFDKVIAIAERGSIRAAARCLNIAQPVLTRNLAALERELGVALFERRARGVSPTPVGVAFIARANSVLHEIRRARDEVDQLRGRASGTVCVGLSTAAHLTLLPPTLQQFRSHFPRTELTIIEGLYPTLLPSLADGAIDFYIGPDPDQKLAANLSREILDRGFRTVLCRSGHPLGSATSLAELVDADWLTTSLTVEAENELGTVFRTYGLPAPKLAVRSQSALTLLTCLCNSDILAFAPLAWAEFPLARNALRSIRLREDLATNDIIVVKRSGLPLTPAASYLLDLVHRAHGWMQRRSSVKVAFQR